MKKLIKRLFPKNKSYEELESPVQSMLTSKFLLGIICVAVMIGIIFLKIDTKFKLLGEGLIFVYILTLLHSWWLFITDSVCSLEATYIGISEIDESTNPVIKASSGIRHHFSPRKIYLTKDNVKYEVCVRTYDASISKGDTVKFYTTPDNVYEKTNGIIRVNSALCLFVTKSAQTQKETDDEK